METDKHGKNKISVIVILVLLTGGIGMMPSQEAKSLTPTTPFIVQSCF